MQAGTPLLLRRRSAGASSPPPAPPGAALAAAPAAAVAGTNTTPAHSPHHAVAVVHCHHELLEEPAGLVLRQAAARRHIREQVAAGCILHCQHQVGACEKHLRRAQHRAAGGRQQRASECAGAVAATRAHAAPGRHARRRHRSRWAALPPGTRGPTGTSAALRCTVRGRMRCSAPTSRKPMMCGCRSFMWFTISRSTYLLMCCSSEQRTASSRASYLTM